MAVILLDADVLIAAERSRFDLARWLETRPDDEFELAAITVAELWHGVERASGAQRSRREAFLKAVFARLPVLPYTRETALRHAQLWAALEAAGAKIGAHDLILAATALEHGRAVATFNTRHFSRISGLEVITPE